MLISRKPADGHAVVPPEVLAALGLKAGDSIVYAIDEDGKVMLARASDPFVNPFALFSEWSSDADRKAFADL